MIEFTCPACQALIRVAAGAGGKKGSCPQCRTKLTVPHQSGSPVLLVPETTSPVTPASPSPQVEFNPVEHSPAPIISIDTEKKPLKSRRRKKKRSAWGGLVVPLFCGAILFGFVGWYFLQNGTNLSPEVTGQIVSAPDIPSGLISAGELSVSPELFEHVRSSLQLNQLSLVSSTHLADITLKGERGGIIANVKPVPEAICVRVSLSGTTVAAYMAKHAKELNQYRMQKINQTATRFVIEWAQAIERGEKQLPNMNEIRDHMALASVVSGFGYHIVAWDGKTASPCVGVGHSGELYFFLRPGTKNFVIRGRDVGSESPGFPGEVVVKIPSSRANLTTPTETTPPESSAEMEPEDMGNSPDSETSKQGTASPMMKDDAKMMPK